MFSINELSKTTKRSFSIVERLLDEKKFLGKDGRPHYPKGRKAVDLLRENLSIVFAEGDEIEYIAEFSFRGPTLEASGSTLLCCIHMEDMFESGEFETEQKNLAYFAVSLSGEQFSILEIPEAMVRGMTLTEEETPKIKETEPEKLLLKEAEKLESEEETAGKETEEKEEKESATSVDDDRQETRDTPKASIAEQPTFESEEPEPEEEDDEFIRGLGLKKDSDFEMELPELPVL